MAAKDIAPPERPPSYSEAGTQTLLSSANSRAARQQFQQGRTSSRNRNVHPSSSSAEPGEPDADSVLLNGALQFVEFSIYFYFKLDATFIYRITNFL